jgi:hypothetical protein
MAVTGIGADLPEGFIEAVDDDVEGAERGEGGAEAVAGGGDADLLFVLVYIPGAASALAGLVLWRCFC